MPCGLRDHLPKEIQAHQGRLAALPRQAYNWSLVSLDELADVGLHDLGRHPEVAARVELFLVEVEAVFAIEIADGTGGFRQDVECAGAGRCHQSAKGWRARATDSSFPERLISLRFPAGAIRGTVLQSICGGRGFAESYRCGP